MFNLITAIWQSMQAGQELSNSAGWKNRQVTINAIMTILGLVVILLPKIGVNLNVSHDDLLAIAGGIAAVLGVLNAGGVIATSKRVGV